jgi:exonuclease SbcD
MFRFLHAADLHLDSPLLGLERYEGAPVDEIRDATRRALANLVRLAIDERVAFVLIAGDVYDGDWKDHNTGLFFARQMVDLRDAKIPVCLIAGNHDAANRMSRSVRLPDNVRILAHDQPETIVFEDWNVAVHGQGFARRDITDNLALSYPPHVRGFFNIGLLHTCAEGAKGHERYAPCTVGDLRAKNYEYWALGHVHQRQSLHSAKDQPIHFPGNLQGRHIRECGAKGCLIVTVDASGTPHEEFRSLDVFRWAECPIHASLAATPDDLLDRFSTEVRRLQEASDRLPMAMRLKLSGRTSAHGSLVASLPHWVAQFRSVALDHSSGSVWVEKVEIQTTPDSQLDDGGSVGELLEYVNEVRGNPDRLRALGRELEEIAARLPPELRDGHGVLPLDDLTWLDTMVAQAESLLASRLSAQEASA